MLAYNQRNLVVLAYKAAPCHAHATSCHRSAGRVTLHHTLQWGKYPDITTGYLGAFDGPKSVVYTQNNQTKYSLWLAGGVYLAGVCETIATSLAGFLYCVARLG